MAQAQLDHIKFSLNIPICLKKCETTIWYNFQESKFKIYYEKSGVEVSSSSFQQIINHLIMVKFQLLTIVKVFEMCSLINQLLSCFTKCRSTPPDYHINVKCSPKFSNCCSSNEDTHLTVDIPITYSDDVVLFYNVNNKYFTLYQKDIKTGNPLTFRGSNIEEVITLSHQNEFSSLNVPVQTSSV